MDGTLWVFLEHADGPLRVDGLRLYEACLDGLSRPQSIVRLFTEVADEPCIPRVWQLLDEPAHKEPSGDRRHILAALARLRAPGIRETLLAELALPAFEIALECLGLLLRGTNEQTMHLIVERFRSVPPYSLMRVYGARAVAAIGGREAFPLVEALTEGLDEKRRQQARLEASGPLSRKYSTSWRRLDS